MTIRRITSRAGILAATLCMGLSGCAADQGSSTAPALPGEPDGTLVLEREPCRPPKQERSYVEPCVSTTPGTTQTPIRDMPWSVQVINRDLMDDRKTLRVDESLRNVSGVQSGR